jgi:membrane protease YdiL (CAAX protease family)
MPALPAQLEQLIVYAALGLLILLRFDARRFGTAEFEDEEAPGLHVWLWRVSWYVAGLGLIAAVYSLYDRPLTVLHLTIGPAVGGAILLGLLLGILGTGAAVAWGVWRFNGLRLPPAQRYPAAVINSVGTALIDEVIFRGMLLGLTLAANWPADLAVAFQAALYGLSTRLGSRGQPPGRLLLALAVGLLAGWVTIQTGGIGAAVIGHAMTRLALFVASGRVGPMRASVAKEEIAEQLIAPGEGLAVVNDQPTGYGGGYG